MPYPNSQWPDVPIRTLIKGVKKIKNVLVKFEEYREYYDFQANVVDEYSFQVSFSSFFLSFFMLILSNVNINFHSIDTTKCFL